MSQSIPIPRPHAAPTAYPPQAPASLPAVGAFGAAAAAAATANANALARTSHHVNSATSSVADPGCTAVEPVHGSVPIRAPLAPCDSKLHPSTNDEQLPTSWPPRPSLELVSRSARMWAHVPAGSPGPRPSSKFEQDFSQVASAVNSVRDALLTGRAGLERPPRESVSGTYFFKRVESGASVNGLDDEAHQPSRPSPNDNVQRPLSRGGGRRHGQVFVPSRVREQRMSQSAGKSCVSALSSGRVDAVDTARSSVKDGVMASPDSDMGLGDREALASVSSSNVGGFAMRSLSADTWKPPGSTGITGTLPRTTGGVFRRIDQECPESTTGSATGNDSESKTQLGRDRESRVSSERMVSSGAGSGFNPQRPPVLTALSLGDSNATRIRDTEGQSWSRSRSAYASSSGATGYVSSFAPRETLSSLRKRVAAVFKPADEEPVGMSPPDSLVSSPSPVHPRRSPELLDGNGSRASRMAAAGFLPGEGAFKEVAAYVLDHRNFSKVPQTALARCTLVSDPATSNLKTKMGAFQVYVENVGDADDWGPGKFPLEDVHRIAVLDLRTLNYDRHGGNILVTRDSGGAFGLVPIDHAFTLPEVVQAVPWAVWMDWPAAKAPMSEDTLHYIAGLEPDLEARMLHDELCGALRNRSYRTLKLATRLLQKGAAAGLSLYDIGTLVFAREGEGEPPKSEFEKIVDEALESAHQRRSHLGEDIVEDTLESPPTELLFPLDGHVPPPSPPAPAAVAQSYDEDYIVKYACRLMDRLVARLVDSKKSGRSVTRARSIPDFSGMGSASSMPSGTGVHAPPPSPFKNGRDIRFRWASSPPRGASGAPLMSPPPPLLESLGESSTGRRLGSTVAVPAAAPVPVIAVQGHAVMRSAERGDAMNKSSPVSPPEFEWSSHQES